MCDRGAGGGDICITLLRGIRPSLVEVLVDEMTPVFEPVEYFPDCVNHVVKDNDLPGSTLGVERGRRVEELELFLEGGFSRLSLAKEQELREAVRPTC